MIKFWLTAMVWVICFVITPQPGRAQECQNPQPSWIFCEDFETGTFLSQWQEVSHKDRKIRETNSTHVFQGNASLKLVFPPLDKDGGGWMHYWWQPASNQGEVYLRWYVKYGTGFNFGGWDIKMAGLEGHLPGVRYRPGAGYVPDGTWFQSRVSTLGVFDSRGPQNPKVPFFYYYHPDQGSPWGDFGYQNISPQVPIQNDKWNCIEIRVKPNTIRTNSDGTFSGLYDGDQILWMDGIKKAHYSGIRWRDRPDVRINDLYQSAWDGDPLALTEQYRWEDNYVISTNRIGCLAAGDNAPPAPPANLTVR